MVLSHGLIDSVGKVLDLNELYIKRHQVDLNKHQTLFMNFNQ